MLHYASGTPTNDDFQMVENELARQRLLSVHGDYFKSVLRWVDDLRNGVLSFEDQLTRTPSLSSKLVRADNRMRQELSDRSFDQQTWVPYEDALRDLSSRLGLGYPRSIMLDSGAFTDWGKGQRSDVDTVIRSYAGLIDRAAALFGEIYLINLDVIPGEQGRRATEVETTEAMKQSDANFAHLKSESDIPILLVFHQNESITRLNEVVDMAKGYICPSPNNDYAQNEREDWTLFLNTAAPGVRCHGLATTGNRMMQIAGLYSGDSTSWKTRRGNGNIDVRWDEARVADQLGAPPVTPFYRKAHVAIERNEYDGKRALPNNKDHITELTEREQQHVRQRAEHYLPFPMVQLDRRAMSIVSLGEIQSVAEDNHALAA
ncbi:hypothetical protein Q8W37_08575 [Shimia thalassica]|uniref:hypothetical protein n=1 Tax=Shimia thalassica TaxID=1715693 RepID=UPI002736D21E|nr:hypothetical protein [Shimia thalassica]MDP2579983.1 hypothetical protein [Shimia thalassica]